MQPSRNTIQKKLVHEALLRLNNHPTAEEIFAEVGSVYTQISRGTVYRILNQLAEQAAILRIQVPNGADRFDATAFPHYHISCNRCGRVYDMQEFSSENICIQVPDTEEYKITGYMILFEGICRSCGELYK